MTHQIIKDLNWRHSTKRTWGSLNSNLWANVLLIRILAVLLFITTNRQGCELIDEADKRIAS
jgi:hypothetical protein